ncbi:circularly permuted type 2 ATP-grasp protein [Paracoccus sp. R12_1]|uniref:circularly permuted type 2 ATP-grasp protein n=1 Tax=unclassified Paracoccus (in: a-proteobacteria) TaxID=2688777 RepID=UPI001ADCD5C4|nr:MULTISPECIES: circularly permuted type 2 ATP-grasp protein [unclassified Paracoccus (in: a-proteobacteria)]MBO9454732.1 circularly permuted type 2 ATP-grasp protein [Paracoccus sp. R12_2]MBO9487362.1 circularly permuted type 2 ATP-grasp protein [Paracoccus sp. R12_1]
MTGERAGQITAGGAGLGAYRPLPGVADEMLGADGQIRPIWSRMAAHLGGLAPADLAIQMARADRYLRDSGVFYRQYGSAQAATADRAWPFSHIPVLLDEDDWSQIASALIQRADLLESVMADLYGPNHLVSSGRLPAGLVAGNPAWLRPMVGIRPRSGHYLHFLAFELGRGPDGKWWVLADRVQAPSGAGYALENRVATARAFSDLYAQENVQRLAGFFRDFRDALLNRRQDRDSRVAILTPGPLNETYYEHAYIARYLGFTLVQGEDLDVRDGQLMVRTVAGLRPIEVLWRRLDAEYADPLELDPASRIGTPGMVAALRAGGLTMVNSLGSGILETRALMAFLPKLAPHLLGEKLAMPNVATWWCGDAAARSAVLSAPDRMILGDALATGMPADQRGDATRAGDLETADLARRLQSDGTGLVAQEAVTLSTTPTLLQGRLAPRPMTIRVFLSRNGSGWTVMPGGFARIGATPDPAAIAMQHGGSAADVWVVSPRPVAPVSMVTGTPTPLRRRSASGLPARAADNLFWLGRYVERSEGIVRLLRAYHTRLAEAGPASAPLLAAMKPLFDQVGVDPKTGVPKALLENLSAAIGSAGRVRDRFSPDAWSALDDIDRSARRMSSRVTPGDDAARALSALLRKLAGISGLVHENMYRFVGWRFLTIGRLHERAMGISAALAVLADPEAPEGALDLAIEIGDSVLTHRRRFSVTASRDTVIDLLALDPLNPRALRHQVDGLRDQIDMLPAANDHGALSPLAREVLLLHADLATADPTTLTSAELWSHRSRIGALSELLTRAYFP